MKSYESTKNLRYSTSKILSALWTGFAISWDRLGRSSMTACNLLGALAGSVQGSSSRLRGKLYQHSVLDPAAASIIHQRQRSVRCISGFQCCWHIQLNSYCMLKTQVPRACHWYRSLDERSHGSKYLHEAQSCSGFRKWTPHTPTTTSAQETSSSAGLPTQHDSTALKQDTVLPIPSVGSEPFFSNFFSNFFRNFFGGSRV